MNLQSQQLKQYNTGKREGGDFVCGVASPKGKWVFCVAEDGNLYCFDTETEEGKLEHILDLEVDRDVSAKLSLELLTRQPVNTGSRHIQRL